MINDPFIPRSLSSDARVHLLAPDLFRSLDLASVLDAVQSRDRRGNQTRGSIYIHGMVHRSALSAMQSTGTSALNSSCITPS